MESINGTLSAARPETRQTRKRKPVTRTRS
jgi:hypothetical protein